MRARHMDTVKSADIIQYADDVTLVVTAETTEEAISKMNKALKEFQEFARGNRLAVEPSKTQLMVCTNRGKAKQGGVTCKIGECEIASTETIKILGVVLDDKLSWEAQNATAAGRATGGAGVYTMQYIFYNMIL